MIRFLLRSVACVFGPALLAIAGTYSSACAQGVESPKAVTARIIIQTGHASPISAATWTSDGRFLVTGSTDAELLVWDLAGHVIARASLGSPNDRSVVKKITVATDGQLVTIEELYFKDMWDIGVASELHQRSYTYRFGDAAAVAGDDELIEPKWKPAMAFLAGSRAMKTALFNRTDLPQSSLGWTLKRVSGVLTMVPPNAGAPIVRLDGALGAASDEGDRRLERIARDFELREAAEVPGARPAPAALPDFGSHTGPPMLSPDGNLTAWLETSKDKAIVHLMDMQGGAVRPSIRFESAAAVGAIGWTSATRLAVTRTAAPPIAIDAVESRIVPSAPTDPVIDSTAIPRCTPRVPPLIALCLTVSGRVELRDPANGGVRCVAVIDDGDPVPAAYAAADANRTKIVLQSASGYTTVFDVSAVTSSRQCPVIAALRTFPGRVGFHPAKPLFWMEGRGGSLAYYTFDMLRALDGLDWANEGPALPLFTVYRLPGDRFFAVDRQDRYDTNLGPDAKAVRWQISDSPFQSYPAQTFMRDYFEPRLIARRMDCALAGTCAEAFKQLPPIARLNRVLPNVQIISARAHGDGAVVTVRVSEGINPAALNGKTHSGVYAVRLFRNGKLVLQHPEALTSAIDNDVGAWRTRNRIDQASGMNTVNLDFSVKLPTGSGSGSSTFSAYAFNEDRVKSDTNSLTVTLPVPSPPRQRRAFVVTIGIDAYDEPRLALRFAAGDAQLISDRLAAIPGYEVRHIALTSAKGGDGKPRRVTREAILMLLSALGGGSPDVSKRRIRDQGFDTSGLDSATPDDIIILSFSGHGWADPQGNFYLVPADGKWKSGDAAPDTSTLISAAELALNFSTIMAGEVAIIIDACHSAASVDAGGFKPGPMGDAGLGQLAFDKGLRILAASQADDVALESATLRQGLLTYALASEGITATGGLADKNSDGRITLDEWLSYAVDRLPSLSEDVGLGRFASASTNTSASTGSRDLTLLDSQPKARAKPQEAALFDFTGTASLVVLRGTPK